MKTVILIFLCFSTFVFSQNKRDLQEMNDNNLQLNELPEIVITRMGDDFSAYLPDRHPDANVQQLQKYFVAYGLGKDYEGYDSYLVIMQNAKGTLTASYNHKGKLINVVERYENVTLPNEVIYSVTRNFPGWAIIKDKYLYEQSNGNIDKKQYDIKIRKDNKTKNLRVSSSGEILKS
jgi:hypothetical protein